MMRFYLFGVVVAIAAVLYLYGRGVGAARCRAAAATQLAWAQIQIIKKEDQINETVLRTNLGDIRRVLREKYTIAD